MDRRAKKQQIRELAEEASHAGKSKTVKVQNINNNNNNNNNKANTNTKKKQNVNVGIADRDPNEVQKDLMKELSGGNVRVVNNTLSDFVKLSKVTAFSGSFGIG